MLTDYPDLLPTNSTPFERALAGPTGRLTNIPVPLSDLWRWDVCPEELLPWLAWAMSGDIWDNNWPVERKRGLIRESFELHRRKGTLYGIERYLAYADARLTRAIVPPDKLFAGPTFTLDERRAWLDRFPQIRIFQFRDRGPTTYGAFTRGAYKLSKTYLVSLFPYRTNAAERWGRRAFLWDQGPHFRATGEETSLRWIERTRVEVQETVYDSEQVLIPGSKVRSLFAGSIARGNFNGRCFAVRSAARSRIVTLSTPRLQTTQHDVLAQRTIAPSLEPINVLPEKVAERGTLTPGVNIFAGQRGQWIDPKTKERKRIKGYCHGFAVESTAPLRLYDCLYLHDPERLPDRRAPSIYAGHCRLGMPSFHAQLSVEIRGKRSRYAAGRFVYGFALATNQKPLTTARTAVQRSMAVRDKILLKTRLTRTITTADGIRSSAGLRSGGLITVN